MTDGPPRRIEARRGFSLSYKGKTLLSLVDPAAQAEGLAAALPVRGRTLYFCPSPLYGYGLSVLLERLGGDSAILCVETDEQLLAVSREALAPLLAGDRRIALVRSTDPAALCGFVRETWGSRVFRRVEPLRFGGGWRLDAPVYEALAAALIRDTALVWGNAMTLVKLGRRYARNALRNLSLIPRAAPLSALDFRDRPLLVLGAGPSLDQVLPALVRFFGPGIRRSEDRPFGILCADTALPCLKDRDIRPDLAVALESQHWNLRDFIGLGGWGIPLAMDLSAHPATGELLGGEVFLFATPWTELSLFGRLEQAALLPEGLPPLGSVGLTTAALALKLSRGPVVAGGLDFSFTLDRFHARSTPGHRDRLARLTRLGSPLQAEAAFRPGALAAISKSGLSVRTDPALRTYRDLFEREFAGEKRLRDIAGPGLPLGLETLSLEEACGLLQGPAAAGEGPPAGSLPRGKGAEAAAFILRERDSLVRLRGILSGEGGLPPGEGLEALLDRNDYLWAHFPECAAAEGRRPPVSNLSFLKRVRVEIDPALALLERTAGELERGGPDWSSHGDTGPRSKTRNL